MADKLNIRAILLKEDEAYVVQGLDYDIAAQGATVEEAKDSFLRTLISQIVIDLEFGSSPLAGIPKAPEEYFNIYSEVVS